MRGLGWLLLLGSLTGCAEVELNRRVERGPLLRRYERPVTLAGGFRAEARVLWPALSITVTSFDRCQRQVVEEYAEEVITERSGASAGPALALGITASTVGAGLLAGRTFFSAQPDRRVIDRGGNYGPSERQLATGWAIGLLGVGTPALVVGLLGYARTGVESVVSRAEQVVSAAEERCHQRPVSGTVELSRLDPLSSPFLPPREAKEGVVSFTAQELAGGFDRLMFNAQPVELEEASLAQLEAFQSCIDTASLLAPEGAPARLASLEREELAERLRMAKLCGAAEGAPPEWLRLLEAELARRQAP